MLSESLTTGLRNEQLPCNVQRRCTQLHTNAAFEKPQHFSIIGSFYPHNSIISEANLSDSLLHLKSTLNALRIYGFGLTLEGRGTIGSFHRTHIKAWDYLVCTIWWCHRHFGANHHSICSLHKYDVETQNLTLTMDWVKQKKPAQISQGGRCWMLMLRLFFHGNWILFYIAKEQKKTKAQIIVLIRAFYITQSMPGGGL